MQLITDAERKRRMIEENHLERYFDDLSPYVDALSAFEVRRGDLFLGRIAIKDNLLFYCKGHFKVYSEMEDGSRKLLRSCTAPMLLGEVELFEEKEEEILTLTIEAADSGEIILLNTLHTRSLLLRDVTFLNVLCASLVEKMRVFGISQTQNTLQPARVLVMEYLKSHAGPNGCYKGNLRVVSEELGISYRHLLRTIAGLIEEGLIEKREGKYYMMAD